MVAVSDFRPRSVLFKVALILLFCQLLVVEWGQNLWSPIGWFARTWTMKSIKQKPRQSKTNWHWETSKRQNCMKTSKRQNWKRQKDRIENVKKTELKTPKTEWAHEVPPNRQLITAIGGFFLGGGGLWAAPPFVWDIFFINNVCRMVFCNLGFVFSRRNCYGPLFLNFLDPPLTAHTDGKSKAVRCDNLLGPLGPLRN